MSVPSTMPTRPPAGRRGRGDHGMATIGLVAATGIILIVVVGIINVIVFQSGRGAARSALDEGARTGTRYGPTGGPTACEQHARAVIDQLLAGTMGTGVTIQCSDAGTQIVATARVHFDGWFGTITDYDGTITATAAKETG